MKRIQTPEQFADRLLLIEKLMPSDAEMKEALSANSAEVQEKNRDRIQSAIFAIGAARLEVKMDTPHHFGFEKRIISKDPSDDKAAPP